MNAPDKLAALLTLTREPFPASRKTSLTGSRADLRVPLREVSLTNGEVVSLYDTSEPYCDPAAEIDVNRGLPSVRAAWIEARSDIETYRGRSHQVLDDGVKHELPTPQDALRIDALRTAAALQRTPRRASRWQRHPDALCAQGHRHAGEGVRGAA